MKVETLKVNLKKVLVDLAVNGKLEGDITQLDMAAFDEVLKPVTEMRDALVDMTANADEDCPSENRTEHFTEAMERADEILERD